MGFLIRFFYSAHALYELTLFSAQELLVILENTLSQNSWLIILSYVAQLEKRRQSMKISTHEFSNQTA